MASPHDHLDKLKIFVTVAEKQKINEASKILGLTQPSVSRAIQTLEAAFDTRLFTRGRYGARLTESGEILYQSASRILHEVTDVSTRIKHSGDELAGNLTVGSYESLAEYLWPDFLTKLRKTYPNLNLSVRTGGVQDSFSRLIDGQVDLLVDAEPRNSEEITSWKLYSDRFSFYASDQLNFEYFSSEDASSLALLYVPKAYDGAHIAIEDHLRRASYVFEREYIFDSFSTVKRLAARGLGIAVLPNRLALEDINTSRIHKVSAKGFPENGFGLHTIYATCAAQKSGDLRIRKLVSQLRGHFLDARN